MLGAVLIAASTPAAAQQGPFRGPTALTVAPSPAKLPDFEFANLNGGTLRSAEMKGKVIVIRFWATW